MDPADFLRRLVTKDGAVPEGVDFLSYGEGDGDEVSPGRWWSVCPWCDADDYPDPKTATPVPLPNVGVVFPERHHPDNGCPWSAALRWHRNPKES